MGVQDYVNIELQLPERKRTIPYNKRTRQINISDGIWLSGKLYRIQGVGFRTQGDGSKIATLDARTPEFFNKTAVTERRSHPVFKVHDLDMILQQ